ncbi:MAG: hypothetical protein J2P15_15095 [Micromonosporaceae bacterium]|nr:hypothetical protein [Micromonosporaceae bacterium]
MTRRDLPPGTQAVQAAHAALDFAVAYPEILVQWHRASNTLVVLATADEISLSWLCDDAAASGLRLIRFYEPDLGGALTAVALEPAARRLVAHLPLALNGREEVRT